MRRFALFTLAIALGTSAAMAQQVDTNTRAGTARIISNPDGTKDVAVGNTLVDLPEDAYLAFFEKRLGDLFLVLYSPGGNACNGFYTWVHATPGAIRRSDSFGTCAAAKDISWDAETVRVTMASGEPGVGDVTFVYDGKGPVQKLVAPLANSGVSAPAGWIGRYPSELAAAAEMQAPLRAMLGAQGLRQLQEMIDLAGPMERDGNWAAGSGCRKHACDTLRAAIAINLDDGRLLVAMTGGPAGPQLWGEARGPLPSAIAEVLR
ncbi:MAG TPA: hypothetical protein ENJ52_13830 [Aliiroseovarius sp.]|nr:hypothetical protein [Aliiroseovarius sp.]